MEQSSAPQNYKTLNVYFSQGVSRNDAETCLKLAKFLESMWNGKGLDFDEKMQPLLKIMCKEVNNNEDNT